MDKDSDTAKTLQICNNLRYLNMTPKEFMVHFLRSKNSDLAFRRRYWATKTGYEGSLNLVDCIRNRFEASSEGQGWWAQYIQKEVIVF